MPCFYVGVLHFLNNSVASETSLWRLVPALQINQTQIPLVRIPKKR